MKGGGQETVQSKGSVYALAEGHVHIFTLNEIKSFRQKTALWLSSGLRSTFTRRNAHISYATLLSTPLFVCTKNDVFLLSNTIGNPLQWLLDRWTEKDMFITNYINISILIYYAIMKIFTAIGISAWNQWVENFS